MTARAWPPLALITAIGAAWELWIRLGDIDESVFPAPSRVGRALVDQAGQLATQSATTIAETLIGLTFGALLGLAIAIALDWWRPVRRAVEPLLVVLQTIPPIVLAPLLVLAFGFGWAPRIVVVVLVVFFPVAIAAAGGFAAVDAGRIDMVRSFGATRWQAFRSVTLPGAVPAIFDGLRISAAYGVSAAAIAEQIGGARGGIGLFISRSQRNFRSDQVLAGVVVIAVLSLALYGLIGLLARRLTPWHHPIEPREVV